jgi:3-hydroxyisobutyrate dehydrogenase-like beta-hydroxyacid dehydrogenase
MALRRIGILSIGEMGYHWARLIADRGGEVITCFNGRSEVTRKRAENAGARAVSMEKLVTDADLIVSVVVPFAAKRVASKVAKALLKTGKEGALYLDANAISPMTAREIAELLAPARAVFVDGCIIGSATKMADKSVVYVSGPEAERIKALGDLGFNVSALGPEVAQASAFKVLYAGLTKGLQGLLVELLVGSIKFGLLDELLKRYDKSFPGLVTSVGSSINALPVHAGRRAEEMVELAQTLAHKGMKSHMAPAVRKVLKEIAALKLGKASETGARAGDLRETLELMEKNGLLMERRPERVIGEVNPNQPSQQGG